MADLDKTELIIIRRRNYLDVEEKNGVWKIAYADFMTAMMAFFLVMWLISATNQETRESVATYFNPIKLTDSTPDRKGINDARRVDPGKADGGREQAAAIPNRTRRRMRDAASADSAIALRRSRVVPRSIYGAVGDCRRSTARRAGSEPRSIRRARKG